MALSTPLASSSPCSVRCKNERLNSATAITYVRTVVAATLGKAARVDVFGSQLTGGNWTLLLLINIPPSLSFVSGTRRYSFGINEVSLLRPDVDSHLGLLHVRTRALIRPQSTRHLVVVSPSLYNREALPNPGDALLASPPFVSLDFYRKYSIPL